MCIHEYKKEILYSKSNSRSTAPAAYINYSGTSTERATKTGYEKKLLRGADSLARKTKLLASGAMLTVVYTNSLKPGNLLLRMS